MISKRSFAIVIALAASVAALHGQAGKGLLDPNVAAEKELLALPHMTPATVKAMMNKRPLMAVTEVIPIAMPQRLKKERVLFDLISMRPTRKPS